MSKRRWALGFAPLVFASAAAAGEPCNDLLGNGTIAVFSSQAATSQCIVVPDQPVQIDFYVCAVLDGNSSPGITGASFRVEVSSGLQDGFWTATPNPNANITQGTLLARPGELGGVNIAFPSCQGSQAGDVILLYSVNFILPDPSPIDLLVKAKSPPNNPDQNCPLFVNCGPPPIFSYIALTPSKDQLGGREPIASRSFIRTRAEDCGDPCFVAVSPIGWGAIKSLFKN
jgi:hypothetical protein